MWGSNFRQAWGVVRALWNTDASPEGLEVALADLRDKVPAPIIWLFGKAQTGKTSIVRYLTGADDAAIGNGFQPCTKTSRKYPFPIIEAPLCTFLDTRGLGEPGYDPAEDIQAFGHEAHVMVVTVKLTDLAQGNLREGLSQIRAANRSRPIILALTCTHEADPTRPHEQPYPFVDIVPNATSDDPVRRLIAEHARQFDGLFDAIVPIDLTKPEEGYTDTDYGGEHLKQTILNFLPKAYRQSLSRATELSTTLKDLHQKHAGPVILGYSSLAATAGAIPIPFVDLVLLPAVQTRMVYHLAKIYGQEMSAVRFLELAGSLGMGLLARQAVREVAKFIPFVGSVIGSSLAAASTYALGRAFCYYYEAVHSGHIPDAARLKGFYQDALRDVEQRWKNEAK